MADPEMDALTTPDTMNTASTDNDLQDAQFGRFPGPGALRSQRPQGAGGGLKPCASRPACTSAPTGPRGLHHLVYEIVDNSVDEALAGFASHIEVTILPGNGVRVDDDGRGIPVDIVEATGISGVETVMTKTARRRQVRRRRLRGVRRSARRRHLGG